MTAEMPPSIEPDDGSAQPSVRQVPQQVPVHVTVPPVERRRAISIAAIVAIVEGVIIVVLLAVIGIGAVSFFGPYGPGVWPFGMGETWAQEERVWMLSEDLGYDISLYLQEGDLDAYLALYDEADPSVDFDAVTEDFNAASEKAQSGQLDVYAGMTETFEDVSTGETIAKVDFELSDWDSGRTVGRLRTHMTVPDEGSDDDPRLTGKIGRDLEPTGMPY